MSFEEGALDSYTFDDIMECDKNPSTKGGYTNLIKHFVHFLRRLHPHLLGEKDEIELPNVTIEVFKAFIDHAKSTGSNGSRPGARIAATKLLKKGSRRCSSPVTSGWRQKR